MKRGDNRVFSIDLLRGTAAFFLVTVHTLWMYGDKTLQFDSTFGAVIHTAGQATAVFLITMGFSFIVTRHQSLSYAVRRALLIFAAGYMLNALKFIVPITVFNSMPEEFIRAYGWSSPLNKDQLVYLFLTGDILQLAGISFLLAGVVRHFSRNQYVFLVLAALSICLYPLIKGYRPGIPGLDYLADLLWGDQWNVYFPVLPWISNIFVGMFLARYFQNRNEGDDGFFRGVALIGVPCFALGAVLCYRDWTYHFNDFFHPGPGGALLALGASLCLFFLYGKVISKKLQAYERFRQVVTHLSRRVTSIYIIQWVLVCWGMGLFGYHTLGLAQILALLPILTALTLIIDYLIWRGEKMWRARLGEARVSSGA